jgi:tetratricopeptide (TPR) repeat protein
MSKTLSITAALRRGQKRTRAGNTERALSAFEAAGDRPDHRLGVQHALALARAGRREAAVAKAAAAAEAAPDDAVPAVFHAYLLLRLGRLKPAGEELERAARLSPGNPIVATLTAALDLLEGHAADACRKLLDGPVTDNIEMLAWVLAIVERKIFEAVGTDSGAIPPDNPEAEKADQPPASAPHGSAGACARRGQKLLEKGKPRSASRFLARAVELKPDNADNRATYGAALFESGEFPEADAQLAAAPEDGPMAGVARFYRAAAAYRLGRYDDALEMLDNLPLTGDAFFFGEWRDYIRGMTLVALDRTDEAGEYLAEFINAEPSVLERRLNKAVEILGEPVPCSTQS